MLKAGISQESIHEAIIGGIEKGNNYQRKCLLSPQGFERIYNELIEEANYKSPIQEQEEAKQSQENLINKNREFAKRIYNLKSSELSDEFDIKLWQASFLIRNKNGLHSLDLFYWDEQFKEKIEKYFDLYSVMI